MVKYPNKILGGKKSVKVAIPQFPPFWMDLKKSVERACELILEAGREGAEFGLLKFATMLKNSPNIGAGEITIRDDPRVLPFGVFLRKTKLNELPQLLNIFIGDMSVVGYRPVVPDTYANYPKAARKVLNTVRPGLTGIGSIIFRDEERYLVDRENPIEFYKEHIIPYKSDLEIWFVKHNSLWLYFKIIIVTALVILFPQTKITDTAFNGLPLKPASLL